MRLFTRTRSAAMAATLLAALASGPGASAQVDALRFNPASFSALSGTYTPVSGSATLVAMTPNNDEGLSGVQPIGFNFPYNGQVMTHFVMSSNGFIKLGTSGAMAPPSSALFGGAAKTQYDANGVLLSANAANNNAISPFNLDLEPNTVSPLDPFSYEVTGSAPNRVLTVQWKNMRDFPVSAGNEVWASINFQAKLYETTGVIEFVYGTFTATAAVGNATNGAFVTAGVGVRAAGQTPENTLVLVKTSLTSWASAVTARHAMTGASGTAAQCLTSRSRNGTTPWAVNATLHPASGQTYRLTPVSPWPGTLFYSPVTVESSNTTFTDLSAGSLGTTIATANNDDANSAEVPIGFTFSYGVTPMTHFILNTNGYIKLGTTGMSAPTANLFFPTAGQPTGGGPLFSSAAADQNLLVPFNMDLQAGTSAAEYRVHTTGTAGNRICTIQWTNVRDKLNGILPTGNEILFDNIRFQVRLYENQSRIEFAYGTFAAAAGGTATAIKQSCIGIRGTTAVPAQVVGAGAGSNSSDRWGSVTWSRSPLTHFGSITSMIVGRAATGRPTAGQTYAFPISFDNDLRPDFIYTLGKLPTPFANPTGIQGIVRNVGNNAYAGGGNATITLSGANSGTGTAVIPAIAPGGSALVDFGNFSPATIGSTNVQMSVPLDDNNGNNNRNWTMDVNANTYSYKNPSQSNSGGVGFTGGTGVFIAKFNSNTTNNLNNVRVDFQPPGAIQYQLVVYSDSVGKPETLVYISNVLTSPAGGGTVNIPICPSVAVNGDFYVGIRQFGTSNVGFSYQSESPIRANTFFFCSPVAEGGAVAGDNTRSADWSDFAVPAPGSPFRLSIEAVLEVAGSAPNCASTPNPADAAVFQSRTLPLTWSAPTVGASASGYDVFFGTNPAALTLALSNTCNAQAAASNLTPGTTYYWRVVPRNVAGAATGCPTWSFTVAPRPDNDSTALPTLLVPCTPATFGFTNNATQSAPAGACDGNPNDDVWYTFVATSVTHRIQVNPIDAVFDPVIDFRNAANVNLLCENFRTAGQNEALLVTNLTVGQAYKIRVYGAGAAGTEGRFNIRVSIDGGWTGTTTDWNTAGNWCDGFVPSSTTGAIIRPQAIQPVLNTNATVLNLRVDAGATLTVAGGSSITVRNDGATGGTLTGGGTINGQVIMTSGGSQASNITMTNGTIQNLLLQNPTGVNLGGGNSINISNSMTIGANTPFANNGLVTFQSGPSGTAYLAPVVLGASYSGTGQMAQERWMDPARGARWAFVGAPVTGATYNEWAEASPTINPTNNASLFWFQESDSSRTFDNGTVVERYGWRIPASTTGLINPGGNIRGHRLYLRSLFLNNNPRLAAAGTPYIGNVSVPVTRTAGQYFNGGYNLIANPYMSTIDFDVVTKGTGVNNAYFIYDGQAGQYQVYVGASGNDEGVAVNIPGPNANRLASSQAFFVRTASNSTLSFEENDKVADNNRTFVRTGAVADRLRVTMRGPSNRWDEAVIRFRAGSTEGYDLATDAGSMGGDYVSVASRAQGLNESLDINTLPLFTGRRSVWLNVRSWMGAGNYSLDFSELETFESYMDIVLVDHLTGAMTNLRRQPSVSFSITANPASQGLNRFELVFNDARVTDLKANLSAPALSAWPNPASSNEQVSVAVSGLLSGAATLQVYDAAGRLVYTQALALTGRAEETYPIRTSLSAGTYTVRCTAASTTMATRLVVQQ